VTVSWWPDTPETPGTFPSPFDELGPHPLARRAAVALMDELRGGRIAPGLSTDLLYGPMGGKMFGVLVVRDAMGQLGVLRAFSATLAGTWDVEGYAPPLFDLPRRAAVEPAGEAAVKRIHAAATSLAGSPERLAAQAAYQAMTMRHTAEAERLAACHRENRATRHARRSSLDADAHQALHALDQESRRDKAERRRVDESHEAERRATELQLRPLERRLRAAERLRTWTSRRVMRALFDTYVVPGIDGRTTPLRALWKDEPPAGAGDCAGAKLLAFANRLGLVPVAMAEFWWGAPPAAGGRTEGTFHPACREKCGPLLPFMLQGLEVAPPRRFSPATTAPPPFRILHEDARLVVFEKPEGLLSVPGKVDVPDAQSLLRQRFPNLRLAHRLDLDTSGLMLAARDEETYVALQRMFLERTVEKRYVALLEGVVTGDGGDIALPIRGDPSDRPRQIVDPVHGKASLTRWKLLEQRAEQTLVALWPLTGRTHQLRVHAAHPAGLGAPIAGDRLYGHDGPRLMLHAEALSFTHPMTGERMSFKAKARF
jgi:tRNA pseudouridine32 synthase/23S rRNA pseudouridine746 synthase